MDLNTIWFILIGVLFIGFFFLEGFDYGVGILLPFLGKDDNERRVIINTIGPHWDGNEVWVLTAGGAIFAAFPEWYATMFSGFYLALALLLFSLIGRGVAFEWRSKMENPRWRNAWDWVIFTGSFVPALLWGVALANLSQGLPIDADFNYTGTFFDLLSPYTLLTGVATLLIFTLHGALFLTMKSGDENVTQRAKQVAMRLWPVVVIVVIIFVLYSYAATDVFQQLGVNPGIAPLGAMAALLSVGYFMRQQQFGFAFLMTGLNLVLSIVTLFSGMYPRVMISSIDVANNLTVTNASSSEYTLQIMTVIALTFVPIILMYQGWTYWVFRKRVTRDNLEY